MSNIYFIISIDSFNKLHNETFNYFIQNVSTTDKLVYRVEHLWLYLYFFKIFILKSIIIIVYIPEGFSCLTKWIISLDYFASFQNNIQVSSPPNLLGSNLPITDLWR